MESKLNLDVKLVSEARAHAARVADDVQQFIDGCTTVAVERTVCRLLGIDGVGGSTLGGFCGGSCHQSVHLRFGGKNRGIPYHFGIGWRGCQQYIIRRY